MGTIETSVLIVGGGPVGLSLAIRLRQYGVPVVLAERRTAPLAFPKGRALSVRSMEIYRRWGIEDPITAAGLPRDQLAFYAGRTLTDPHGTRVVTNPAAHPLPSPTFTLLCSQDRLEPLLRAEAERRAPGSIRFGTELTGLTMTGDGVTACLRDHTGRQTTVATEYLIAADGARSTVRDLVGITMTGDNAISHNLNILFDADLAAHVAGRASAVYTVMQPGLHGTFLPVDNARRWLFNLVADGTDPGLADFDDATCLAVIRAAAGLPDLAVDLRDRRVWRACARVADRFQHGRIFLAGDAAHEMTPYGGFGLNCGIADADNLAWKLAFVHHGWATPGLLDTYEPERRPVAAASAAESHRRLLDAMAGTPHRPRPSDGLTLGYHYRSAAILDDGTAPPPADPVADYVATGRPGHRAPHEPVAAAARGVLDVIDTRMTLLIGPQATTPPPPGRIPLTVTRLDDDAAAVYGIGARGAVLIRPDDHIAWRGTLADDITTVLTRLGLLDG